MIRIAICDDNGIILDNLKGIVTGSFNKFTDDFEITTFQSGSVLMHEHNANPFDVIFLDIDMPKTSGFDVAKKLRDEFSRCFIVFVTSHSELVYESMDFQPFNFIRKNCDIPVEKSVEQIVEKLMRHMKQNEKIILEDNISGRHAVYIREITYLESSGHYVLYHVVNYEQPIKMREGINECEKKYSAYDFVRIHKKYLVNLRFISDVDKSRDEIIIRAINKKLPMSKNYKNAVDEKYMLYLRTMV